MAQIFLLFLLISLCLLMMGIINADAEPSPAVEKIFLGPGRDRGSLNVKMMGFKSLILIAKYLF
jgi:hypothetical protein